MIIHFHSKVAKLFLSDGYAAFTFGSSIYVKGSTISERMLAHEEKHVEQFTRYGIIGFMVRYLWELWWWGYSDAPLEKEARNAEVGLPHTSTVLL